MLDIEDPGQLQNYLLETGRIEAGENTEFTRLTGGVSCSTVLVRRQNGPSFVIKQALRRLRVATRWVSSPERSHREAMGIEWLNRLTPDKSIPALLFEDRENHVLAMAAVPSPHDNWKSLLLAGTLLEDHARQFGSLLGAIHANAYRQSEEIEPVFRDYSFIETLRLEPYYAFTRSQVEEAAGFLDDLLAETRANRMTLVHGDYSPKNVLVHQGRLILLDHETIHWGDPMFDLGFSLTHFLSKANHDPGRKSGFARLALVHWQTYRERVGDSFWDQDCEARAVRHTLGCLLARVMGRSPLEYLDSGQQDRQRECVIGLMRKAPDSVPVLIRSFIAKL